jgi:hypothetical protein
MFFSNLTANGTFIKLNVYDLPYCDLAASLAIRRIRAPGMTMVAVEFPEAVHYIAARIRTPRAEPPGKPAGHLTAQNLIPAKARRVDVHEA